MLEYRALIVLPLPSAGEEPHFVCVCGNQRLAALREMGADLAPCMVVRDGTPIEEVKAIALLDNSTRGGWDPLTLADWGEELLSGLDLDFGALPLPSSPAESLPKPPTEEEKREKTLGEALSSLDFRPLYYEAKEVEGLSLEACIDNTLYLKKLHAVEESSLGEKAKDTMRILCQRFRKIDYEGLANYYIFHASPEERRVMQRLRLVLVDDGSIGGFLEDGLLRVYKQIQQPGGEGAEEEAPEDE